MRQLTILHSTTRSFVKDQMTEARINEITFPGSIRPPPHPVNTRCGIWQVVERDERKGRVSNLRPTWEALIYTQPNCSLRGSFSFHKVSKRATELLFPSLYAGKPRWLDVPVHL